MLGTGVKSAVRMYDDSRRLNADTRLQCRGNLSGNLLVCLVIIAVLLDFNGVLIGEISLKNPDKIFARNAVLLADNRLYIAWENVYRRDDKHIVLSA